MRNSGKNEDYPNWHVLLAACVVSAFGLPAYFIRTSAVYQNDAVFLVSWLCFIWFVVLMFDATVWRLKKHAG